MQFCSKLPPGFYDFVGESAFNRINITYDFFDVGESYGFKHAVISPVGFEDTFKQFGTAAIGRTYTFSDAGKRRLMLNADSLAATIRAYLNYKKDCIGQPLRIMSRVDIFRHRKKKYRHWSHLVTTIFNEKNSFCSDTLIVQMAWDFIRRYYKNVEFRFNDFGIAERIFQEFEISVEDGKRCLYNIVKQYKVLDADRIPHQMEFLLKEFISFQKSTPSEMNMKLKEIRTKYPFLKDRTDYIEQLCDFFLKMNINFYFSWNQFRAIEYHSGLTFLVFDKEKNKVLADGGGYHHIVNQLSSKIHRCNSFACSLDSIADDTDEEKYQYNVCHVFYLDCSIDFFTSVCRFLRTNGLNVYEHWSVKSITGEIARLPRHKTISFCIIGKKEEIENIIYIQNSLNKGKKDSLNLT